ncbi:MAG: tRNA (adenosine(37)-N6)-dimethylallyltransferase MiaA [Rhodospirillaceae bacterium]|nr:tRNA (adenosine(37)-N6)-dimethylallyltransferase MiaA [Rhodospirillaceae bacterium]
MNKPVLIIGGPTSSGKSALAVEIALSFNGVVINADSMQVYRDLAILTGRPDAATMAQVSHRLFGVLDGDDVCSAGRWREMASKEIEAAWKAEALPIVVGGTGLYLRALTRGLAEVPEISGEVRGAARALYDRLGGVGFQAELAIRDPEMAARLHSSDRQRLMRAWEVVEATGHSLAEWQAAAKSLPGLPLNAATLVLMPPRDALYGACDSRFLKMMEDGALAEVQRLAARRLAPERPVMKALGVRPLIAHMAGDIPLEEAVALAQRETRRYAKRQSTWFRNQTIGISEEPSEKADIETLKLVSSLYSENIKEETFSFLNRFLLTLAG